MNIVVCLKTEPGTTEVKINPQTNQLIRQGIKNIINPFDSYALEGRRPPAGNRGGEVTVISMGLSQHLAGLRRSHANDGDFAALFFPAGGRLPPGHTNRRG